MSPAVTLRASWSPRRKGLLSGLESAGARAVAPARPVGATRGRAASMGRPPEAAAERGAPPGSIGSRGT
eukprot:13964523-Alexandrium_andersonii.AAC.1